MRNLVGIIVFQIGANVIGIPEIHWHNLTEIISIKTENKSKYHS